MGQQVCGLSDRKVDFSLGAVGGWQLPAALGPAIPGAEIPLDQLAHQDIIYWKDK